MADRTRSGAEQAARGVASFLERLPTARALAVLTYHRVAPADARTDLHAGLCVDPAAFAEQVRMLQAVASPVSLDDVLAAAAGTAELPARAVHITFDDAYADIEEHAWPVLAAAGVPATMFVPTAFPDSGRSFWWDRLSHAVRSVPAPSLWAGGRSWPTGSDDERDASFTDLRARVAALPHDEAMALVDEVVAASGRLGATPSRPATSSWAGLRAMAAEGLALAAHTREHPFLDRVGPHRLATEITGSLADLRDRTGGAAHPVLAYPSGAHDDAVVEGARAGGVRLAFTTERGVVDLEQPDWLRLPRINVGRRAGASLVRVQLDPRAHRARALARSGRSRRRSHRTHHNGRRSWS
ncbi:MAG TPA: polysaccharide deacetylase family protein [Aquihabitans sp.]|nr:polysaccharide deacetylase family protein [Aquihabitans sp.]